MTPNPRVSVLLLTLNPGPNFAEILQSVLSQDPPPFETLAVDSGSTDGTVERMRAAGVAVDVIPQSDFGHGRTRNLIASRARGDLLAFLTHDARPTDDSWLRELAKPFEDQAVAGVYGRQIAPVDAAPIEIHLLDYIYPAQDRLVTLAPGQRFQMPTHFFSNANSMIRRSVWEHIPFPDGVIMCEDQWWAKVALTQGHVIAYSASAVVTHSHHLRARDLFRRSFDTGVAMKGCDETPAPAVAIGFLRYVWSLSRFIARRGSRWQLGSALTLAMSRAMGYATGSNYALLPRQVCRKLSMHRYYWR
jgi:rhamnosyltransferase